MDRSKVSEGAIAGTEALLALNPIHERAQQKSKESEHEKENVILCFRNGRDFQVVQLTEKFLRHLSSVLSDLYDYLFVQPDIHRG